MKRFMEKFLKKEKGAITYMTAVMLIVLLGFTALAVDFGLHYYTGAKLQNAVDSAATAVASNIGSDDLFLEEVAYDYLARNGFDHNGKYKDKIDLSLEKKGIVNYESVEDERYITEGYYKVTVTIKDSTLFAKVLADENDKLEAFSTTKHAYVKCSANFVDVPRALNYTIFAGSLEDKPNGDAAMKVEGRTNPTVNSIANWFENAINGINAGLIQPLKAWFGGTADYNDLVSINLSEIVTDGDVHSNSNITIGVQALNASRVLDRDYDGNDNVAAYQELDKQINSAYDDYGQVTYTAVGKIRFNNSLKNSNDGYSTHVYVQNQQYLQQTQAVLKIIDLIDFDDVSSEYTLKEKYTEAANAYLNATPFLPDSQKQAIINQVDNLRYEGLNKYSLENQKSIVYNVSQKYAEEFLDDAEEKGYDGLIEEYENTGIDQQGNPMLFANRADKSDNINYGITFYKKDADGDVYNQAAMTVRGTQVNRNYNKILRDYRSELTPQTTFGAKFAIAMTFQEKSDFIAVPNLKPYFTRQVNKSIRNATKTKEENGDANAGERSIKMAVKSKNDEYQELLETTKFTDDKYRDPQKLVQIDTTPLFTKYKASESSGLTYYYDDTYQETSEGQMGWVRTFNEKHTKFKGYNLYDSSGILRTPSSFVTEKREQLDEDGLIGKSAIDKFYETNASKKENAVTKKKASLIADNTWSYSNAKTDAKNKIEGVEKPNIEHDDSPGQVEVVDNITLDVTPDPTDVFLGAGTTGNGMEIKRTDTIRARFDDVLDDYAINYNESTDTYSINKNTSGFTQNSSYSRISSDLVFQNNTYYTNTLYSNYRWFYAEKGGTTYTENIVLDGKSVKVVVQNNSTLHTGTIDASAANKAEILVKSGSTLYVHGDLKVTNGGYITSEGGTIIVEGQIYCTDNFRLENGSKIIQLSAGSQKVKIEKFEFNGSVGIYAVGDVYSNPKLKLQNNSCIYTLGSIYSNNNTSDGDIFEMLGTSKVYVRGALTSTSSTKRHIYIHDCTDCVLSVLGNGFSDCFDNKCSQIYDGNNSSNTKIYLGTDTRVYEYNANNVTGLFYCFGNLTFDTTGTVTISGNKDFYVAGNLSASSGTISATASGGPTIYIGGDCSVKNFTLSNGTKLHVSGTATGTTLSATNNSEVDIGGSNNYNYTNVDGSSKKYTTGEVTFDVANINVTGYRNKVMEGVNKTSMTLNGCKIKMTSDVTLTGNLTLNNTILYITGDLSCADVILKGKSELYVDGDATVANVSEAGASLFLVRKDDSVTGLMDLAVNSDLSASGTISVAGSSLLYVDGDITAKAYTASGKDSRILGYKSASINATGAYNSGSPTQAFYNPDGNGAEIFCGEDSSVNQTVGLILNGYFFYPDNNLTTNRFYVDQYGYGVIDGNTTNGQATLTISSWAYINSGGTFYNYGKTTISGCRISNYGNMYFLGGQDMTGATTSTVNGASKSDPDFLNFDGSESYIGKFYNGSTALDTYTYKGNFESRGNTYIDASINVNGWTKNGASDMLNNGGLSIRALGVSVYVPSGTTYINGYLKTYSSTSNGAGVLIGNSNFGSNNQNNLPGLVLQGNLKIAGPIYNFGNTYIFGKIEQNNANVVLSTDWHKNNGEYQNGRSILNGTQRGFITPTFYCSGTKNDDGTFNTFTWDLIGYVENNANIYVNANMNVMGYVPNGWNENPYWGDYAYFNNSGAKCFYGGWVRLNSKRIMNEWTDSNGNVSIFSCEGRLTYGSICYNCSKMYVGGDITNNETDSETCRPSEKKYYDDMWGVFNIFGKISDSVFFAFMNGCYKVNGDMVNSSTHYENNGWTHFNQGDNMYDDAEVYCGGTLQSGKMKYDGTTASAKVTGGSLMSVGDMYIGGNMNILSFDETGSGLSNYKHSYYYTALWMWHNTKTFVGGSTYSGAGTVIGTGSIFMTGQNFTSARAFKFNANIYVNYSGSVGVGNHVNVDWVDRFKEAYFYVGGNFLANTFGRTNYESGSTLSSDAPREGSRDTRFYSNSNVYIGGSLYNNAKLQLYQNVTMLVAGKKDLIHVENGAADVLEAYTNGIAKDAITKLLDCNYRAFIYQLFDEGMCSNLVVNGHMFVEDTCRIKDMCQNYIYGSFSCHDFFELGQQQNNYDETDAKKAEFRTPKEKKRIAGHGENKGDYKDYSEAKFLQQYRFENAPYMAVDGGFSSGERLNPFVQFFVDLFGQRSYTRLYASATLRVNGDAKSCKYFDLRHDAKLYANGNIYAYTNIDAGSYTHLICTGAMTSEGQTGSYNKGYIRVRDQSLVLVGGNMNASAYIEIGKNDDFKRTDTTINKVDSLIATDPQYSGTDDENNGSNGGDNAGSDSQNQGGVDGEGSSSDTSATGFLDTTNELMKPDDNDTSLGTEVFVKDAMIAKNGYILECAYSSVMVGQFVFTNKHITVRHNADLWVMPEMFDNETYGYSETGGYTGTEGTINLGLRGLLANLWNWIKGQGFSFNTKFTVHSGSIYTLGELFVGKNASVMGTYDCQVPGQCVLRQDSLVYMGHNFSCYASQIMSAAKGLFSGKNQKNYTGFDGRGTAGPGKKYICRNWSKHSDQMNYPMTVSNGSVTTKFKCPECGRVYDLNNMSAEDRKLLSVKDTQVSFPVVVYAQNAIDIVTTINMQLTYVVSNKGKVNIYNVYTTTENAEKNARELPNAVCSYQNDIDYFAMYGKLGSLFYAPRGNINLDGYYSEIWGSVIGNTVEMNSYYLALHRFENWRTMQLNIAESGNIYIVPKREYEAARDNVEDIYLDDGKVNEDLPEGAQPFFF